MCGRFVQDVPPDQLMKAYGLSSPPELPPRYNLAPSQQVAVVRQRTDGERELVLLRWGLIPSWAKDPAVGYRMINARSETAHDKPSFRQALRARRCVVPAGGFYEWEQLGREKIPHYFHRRDRQLMSLAGLWESWTSPQGSRIETCTILTTAANSLVGKFHDRMPLLLPGDALGCWLDCGSDDVGRLAEVMSRSCPAAELDEYVVSKVVNSPGIDRPECIVPAGQGGVGAGAG